MQFKDNQTGETYTKNELIQKFSEYQSVMLRMGDLIKHECIKLIDPLVKNGEFDNAKKVVGEYFSEFVDVDGDQMILPEYGLLLYYISNAEKNYYI